MNKKSLLINADCLVELDKLALSDTKIQLTVTSPPYYNAKEYSHWDSYDEYMEWLVSVFKKALRLQSLFKPITIIGEKIYVLAMSLFQFCAGDQRGDQCGDPHTRRK